MRFAISVVLCLFLAGCGPTLTGVPETASTLRNWSLGREYRSQGRFEMARQHYVLALADSRTPEAQLALMQEIEAAERQIEALR